MLQDAQQRLVYRSQAIIQTNIRSFTPSAEDLAYPDCLEKIAWDRLVAKEEGGAEVGASNRVVGPHAIAE